MQVKYGWDWFFSAFLISIGFVEICLAEHIKQYSVTESKSQTPIFQLIWAKFVAWLGILP